MHADNTEGLSSAAHCYAKPTLRSFCAVRAVNGACVCVLMYAFITKLSTIRRKKHCTTIAAMPQLQAGTDGNTALREVKYWHGKRDQGMEKLTTSKTECEPVAQSILIVRDVKSTAGSQQPDRADGDEIFITEGYI